MRAYGYPKSTATLRRCIGKSNKSDKSHRLQIAAPGVPPGQGCRSHTHHDESCRSRRRGTGYVVWIGARKSALQRIIELCSIVPIPRHGGKKVQIRLQRKQVTQSATGNDSSKASSRRCAPLWHGTAQFGKSEGNCSNRRTRRDCCPGKYSIPFQRRSYSTRWSQIEGLSAPQHSLNKGHDAREQREGC